MEGLGGRMFEEGVRRKRFFSFGDPSLILGDMVRPLCLLALMGSVCSSALASFEMVLVADNGSNSTATRRIHRFDPDTGVYLGAFGNFSTDIRSMTIRQGRNEAIVTAGSGVYVFDYNTGALKRDYSSTTFTDIAISQDDTYFYGVTGGSVIWRTTTAAMDAGSLPISAFITEASTTQISSIAATAGGNIVTGQNRAGALTTFSYNGVSGGVGTQTVAFSPGSTLGAAENVRGGGAIQAYNFSGVGRAVRFSSFGSQSGALFVASGIGTATAAAAAHTGGFVAGIDALTPTQGLVTRFTSTGIEMQSFGGSVLRKPVAMATVLAPEPGTMIALGAGVAVLLRRRKRRA